MPTPPIVILTQDPQTSGPLADQLEAGGSNVVRWPLVRIRSVPDDVIGPTLAGIAEFDGVILPSPSAVLRVADQMTRLGLRWSPALKAGLIGPASVEAFRAAFGSDPMVVCPDLAPFDGEALVRRLEQRGGIAGSRWLVLNRPDGRIHWVEALRAAGAEVTTVAAYTAEPISTPPPDLASTLAAAREQGRQLHWVVGAASQIATLAGWLAGLDAALAVWARACPLHVPHPALRSAAQSLGFDEPRVYDDRRTLIERLQCPQALDTSRDGARDVVAMPLTAVGPSGLSSLQALRDQPSAAVSPRSVSPRSASPTAAATEEVTVLSSAQHKDPSKPFTAASGKDVSDAKVVDAKPVDATGPGMTGAKSPAASAPAASATGNVAMSAATSAASSPAPSAAASPAASSVSSPAAAPAARGGAAALPGGSSAGRSPEPPQPPSPPTPPRTGRGGGLWALLVLFVVVVLAGAGWWYGQQRFLANERESARRIQEAETRAARLEDQIKALRDAQSQLVSRSTTLESKIAESANQQEQLQTLYDEMARNRGDSTLSDVEQAVTLASQHLALTGNVQAALLALENAEKRLGSSEQSQAIGARRLILQDIERLKALPEVDLTRYAARLDEVINRIDRLPMLSEASQPPSPATPADAPAGPAPQPTSPAVPAPAPAADPALAAGGSPPSTPTPPSTSPTPPVPAPAPSALERLYARLVQGGARSLGVLREEFRSLVTIRRIDQPDTLLLSPDQKRLARENVRMLLLNARLNLLNRHEALFKQDVGRVIETIQRLFDPEQAEVKSAIATLQSLQSQPLAVALPSLSESLGAVRAARAASEKRS